MRSVLIKTAYIAVAAAFAPIVFVDCLLQRFRGVGKPPRLFWGPVPIISNKYWSAALRAAGFDSRTVMVTYYDVINKRDDFDLYLEDIFPKLRILRFFFHMSKYYVGFLFAIRNFDVFHLPFSGCFLGFTPLRSFEPLLFKLAKKNVIIIGYGADFYVYSHIGDPSLRHALLMSYPEAARKDGVTLANITRWSRHADCIVGYSMLDGLGRWDVLTVNPFAIDTSIWNPKTIYSDADGRNGIVRVIHAPNHRGFKGSEFVIAAVEKLRSEGLNVELVLLERKQNEEVRQIMREKGDILVEQLIYSGYAFNAIEGMATGLPVLSNLENEIYTRLIRRYAYLNECPILSTTPETIFANLKLLITNPDLRRLLGEAGRRYVEKYHSYETAQYLFGSIYKKILENKDVDLMNLFHPLKSPYNRSKPIVEHPLIENRLPPGYPLSC